MEQLKGRSAKMQGIPTSKSQIQTNTNTNTNKYQYKYKQIQKDDFIDMEPLKGRCAEMRGIPTSNLKYKHFRNGDLLATIVHWNNE